MKLINKISMLASITFCILSATPLNAQADSLTCSEKITNFINHHWNRKSKKLIKDSDGLEFTTIEACIIGKSKQEILKIFGNSNLDYTYRLRYYINKKPKNNRESKSAVFEFDKNGNCTAVYILGTLPVVY